MTEETEQDRPSEFSPEWSPYVLTFFTEDELFEGYPKLNGLRRVAQLLKGPIRLCTSQIFAAHPEFASICTTITIGNDETVTQSGCADASAANTEKGYCKYPTAIAESRAEARALRKVLSLSICSYEELGAEKTTESLPDQPPKITGAQIALIDRQAKKFDVKVTLTKDSPYVEAQAFCKTLNSYQGNRELITEEMKGYNENWKS